MSPVTPTTRKSRVTEEHVRDIVDWLNYILRLDKIGVGRLFERNTRIFNKLALSGLVDFDEMQSRDGRTEYSLNMVQVLNGAFGYETGTQGSIVTIRDTNTGEITSFAQVKDGEIQS